MSGPRASWRAAAGRSAAVVCLLAGAAAGCTNTSSAVAKNPHTGTATASDVAGVQQVVLTSGPDLRFHPSTITVHPGKVRVVLKNVAPGGGPPHNIQAASVPGLAIGQVDANETQSVTFTAPAPGRYSFVCTFHRAQGQTGVLVVKPG